MKPTEKTAPSHPASADPARRRRKTQFRLLAVTLPVVMLLLVELILRASGYGYRTSFFREITSEGKTYLVENDQFTRRFFPRGLERTQQPLQLAVPKPPGTYRLFVLGESAAMGDPEPSYGFGRILEQLLQAQFPGQRFEVVNVAITAINSHVVRQIARDCSRAEGDCWVIYMGNNEVVGPYGAGTIFGKQTPSRFFIQASLAFKATALGQLLTEWQEAWTRQKTPKTWGGMEMFLGQQVRRDDPRMAVVYEHFRHNLTDIISSGANAGAKVLVASVASNLKDCAPFSSQHRLEITPADQREWELFYQSGVAEEEAGSYSNAALAYLSAQRLDDTYADLRYRLGRSYWNLGHFEQAALQFRIARDLDTLRFRVDSRLNNLIRQSASNFPPAQVRFVDVAEAVTMGAPHTVPGDESFHEHVHFNFEGNYRVAASLARAVASLLTSTSGDLKWLPADECARRLGWTEFDQQRVGAEILKRLQQPPFTQQLNHEERELLLRQRVLTLEKALTPETLAGCVQTYEAALARSTNDWILHENFARLLQRAERPVEAEREWRTVLALRPRYAPAYYGLGNLLDTQNHSAQAAELFRRALTFRPDSPEALNGLALALSNQGRLEEATALYEKAIRLKPAFAEVRINFGQLLAQQHRGVEAASQYAAALSVNSNSAAAHINLGKLLMQEGDAAKARTHYESALRIDPDNAVAHYNLANAFAGNNDPESIRHYAEAIRVRPKFTEARYNLALTLAKVGRNEEALEQFKEVVRLQPKSAEAYLNLGVAWAKTGDLVQAGEAFRETLRLEPGNETARRFLAQAERGKN